MAGHSKWSNIKHKKSAEDKKRAKVFSRVSKLIRMAVKEGGSDDPEYNAQLRLALDKAKEANMPKDNIQRAIDRGMGRSASGAQLQESTYEGFGPGGVAMVIVASTDNANRTSSDLKNIMKSNGGSLGAPGSAMYMFKRTQKGGFKPTMTMDLPEADQEKLKNLIEELEENEDVDAVYTAAALQSE